MALFDEADPSRGPLAWALRSSIAYQFGIADEPSEAYELILYFLIIANRYIMK